MYTSPIVPQMRISPYRSLAPAEKPRYFSPPSSGQQKPNADQLIDFRQGDLWAALGEEEVFDVVVSNPPYIPDDEWQAVPTNVKNYEPTMALRGGIDGLALIRTILDRIDQHLVSGGLVMIEVAASRAGEALAMLSGQTSLTNAAIIKDLEGHERFVTGERQ